MYSVQIVQLVGPVTMQNVARHEAELLSHAGPQVHVILDLTLLELLNTLALGLMLELRKRLLEQGGKLSIVCPDARLRGVLRQTHLDRVLTITQTLEEASSWSPGPPA
ncbi:MAG: STAS domain-containing protein [Tepidisphaerales bacterium]